MPTQFMTLTNRLIRRLNEVPIPSSSDFASTRGVQQLAKDAIKASILTINSKEYKWPFNATTGQQLLTVGTQEYNWPSDLKVVEWESFRLVKDDVLNVTARTLRYTSREQWYEYWREDDLNAGSAGLNVPHFVFERHGYGFAVSPSPDKAYSVAFDYYVIPTDLVNFDATSNIPSQYDEAIIQGALYHFYMFRDNTTQAREAELQFEKQVGLMRSLLINKNDDVYSGMVVRPKHYGTPTIKV